MPASAMLDVFTTRLIDTIYPPRCLACAHATERAHGLCPDCWRDTHFIAGAACWKCGLPLVGDAADGDLCEGCLGHPPAWDRGAAAILYHGAGRRMVLALKHGDRLDMVGALAGWMARAGADHLARADVIAPVPLHWRRLLRRRFNQSAELARHLGRMSGKPVVPDLMMRHRATPTQEKRTRDERARNLAGAIAVTPKRSAAVAGRAVLVIDDVLTSGATLSGCAEALRAAGAARVDVLVLARVAMRDSLHI